MIYCISDVHGEYTKYRQLFGKINLQEEDTLYLLGDILDRGAQSMELLLDMMRRPNVVPIFGNHEIMALTVLPQLAAEITEDSIAVLDKNTDFTENLVQWIENGGQATIDSLRNLSRKKQQEILKYLGEFSLYEEIRINNQKYLLVHSVPTNLEEGKAIEDYNLFELIWGRSNYDTPYRSDTIMVTGHTPTRLITAHNGSNTIFRNQYHIAIDCGASYKGRLGAICLDTGEEYYV